MNNKFFQNIPSPSIDDMPKELKELIIIRGKAKLARSIPIDILLSSLFLHQDNNYLNIRIKEIMKQSPSVINSAISTARKGDFRKFIQDMVNQESDNIVESLHRLHDGGFDKEYQAAIRDWAKFGFGTEQKVDINVGVEQKKSLVESINSEYAFSEAIDADYEMVEPKALPQNSSAEHTFEFQGDAPEPEPINYDNAKPKPNRRYFGRKKKEQ